MKNALKIFLALLLVGLLIVPLSSCSDDDKEDKPKVEKPADDGTDDGTGDGDTDGDTDGDDGISVVWTGEGNTEVELTEFADFGDDDVIRIKVRNDSGSSKSGWGIGKLGPDWSGQIGDEIKAGDPFEDGDEVIFDTMTVGEMKTAIGSGTSVFFNFYNDCTLLEISVVAAE